MTRRITTQRSEDDHYKVRVVIAGAAVLHLASATEPRLDDESDVWHADWLSDPEKGDTVGLIDWSAVSAVTWRWTGVSDLERLSEADAANGHGIGAERSS